jgi:hypothetical protein
MPHGGVLPGITHRGAVVDVVEADVLLVEDVVVEVVELPNVVVVVDVVEDMVVVVVVLVARFVVVVVVSFVSDEALYDAQSRYMVSFLGTLLFTYPPTMSYARLSTHISVVTLSFGTRQEYVATDTLSISQRIPFQYLLMP